jgi:hypothetical protein
MASNERKTGMMKMNDSRVLELNFGDWSMLLIGVMLAGWLSLFV